MNLSTISLALTRLGWMFSPAALFAAGEQGVWYDPSDLTTLFQDSAGTIPVTAVQQPVGLMLDKSKGLVLGPEIVVNGDFSADSNWTKGSGWTISGGTANVNSTGAAYLDQPNILTAGKTYRITFTVSNFVSGNITLSGTYFSPGFQTNTNGTFSVLLSASSSLFRIGSTISGSYSLDNISVKELPGNHAFQTTSASRPVLSARYNLLTKTEQFDDAVWVKNAATVTANATTAPDGTLTADLLTMAGFGIFQLGVNYTSGVGYTFSFSAAPAAGSVVSVRLNGIDSTGDVVCLANASTGNIIKTSGLSVPVFASTLTPNGFYRFTITIPGTSVVTGTNKYISFESAPLGIYVWGADLRISNDALGQPAYQRVNTSTDYDTVGFKPYLAFDGVDDSLVTNSIDFTATDKMTVFAGVRKLNDTTGGVVYETATGSGIGAFYVYAGTASTATGPNWTFGSRGTGNGFVQSSGTYAAPLTNVITGTGDISGGTVVLRANGTSTGSQFGDQGTGNYGNYPLFIGRRNQASLPYNGRLYSLIVRGAASTTAQITSTEGWVNQRTGAYT